MLDRRAALDCDRASACPSLLRSGWLPLPSSSVVWLPLRARTRPAADRDDGSTTTPRRASIPPRRKGSARSGRTARDGSARSVAVSTCRPPLFDPCLLAMLLSTACPVPGLWRIRGRGLESRSGNRGKPYDEDGFGGCCIRARTYWPWHLRQVTCGLRNIRSQTARLARRPAAPDSIEIRRSTGHRGKIHEFDEAIVGSIRG